MEFQLITSSRCQESPLAGRLLLSTSSQPQQASSSTARPPLDSTSASSSQASTQIMPSMPVPLITVGKVFAPIPTGRATVAPEAMEAARALGLMPMLAAAVGATTDPEQFWDVAALTDPLTAANLLQGVAVGSKRVLFVERGAAERLARGKEHLTAMPMKKQRAKKDWTGFFRALNPMAAFESVCSALQQGITKAAVLNTATAANRNEETKAKKDCNAVNVEEEQVYRLDYVEEKKKGWFGRSRKQQNPDKDSSSTSGSSSAADAAASIDSTLAPFMDGSASQRTSQLPALAHLPVRLALSLLRGAPGCFLLLSGRASSDKESSGTKKKKTKNRPQNPENRKKDAKKTAENAKLRDTNDDPDLYSSAAYLDSLKIHYLNGLNIVLNTPAGSINFTPAFLSEATMQRYWKLGITLYKDAVLAYRRFQRREFVLRLQLAAAMVAGGGDGGGAGASIGGRSRGFGSRFGGGSDDEGGDFEEPPELQEAIHELAEELAGQPFGMQPNAIVRFGATLTLGMLALIGPAVHSMGELIDKVIMNFGGSNLVFGVPNTMESSSVSLDSCIKACASYNAAQAANRACNTTHSAPLSSVDEISSTLALAGLCMGIGVKLGADEALILGKHFLQSSARRMIQNAGGLGGEEGSGVLGIGGGGMWAAASAAAAAAAASSKGDKLEVEFAAVVKSVLPSLEFNGFSGYLPAEDIAAGEILGKLLLGDSKKLDFEANFMQRLGSTIPLPDQPSVLQKVGPDNEQNNEGKAAVPLGLGLILLGDPGWTPGMRTRRGFSLDGAGVSVGVDDARRYIL